MVCWTKENFCDLATTPALRATPPSSEDRSDLALIPRLPFHSLQNDRQRSIVIERDGFCCAVYSYFSGHDSASFAFAF